MRQTETNDTFHSEKNSGLNFWKFQFKNGTAFPRIYEHKKNLARCVQMFGNVKSYQEFLI